MKEIDELRNLTPKELQTKLLSLRDKQFKLRMKRANGSLDKPHSIRHTRKTIARIKTIMSEKVGKSHVE
ncbi:50S ribosomal protein L29 [Legionella fairfieldensis]|uniref:50S ribosomal protein L29 n=1 Tax=Legionella fairfieldensis TaxID=45064 RepID=UPI000490F75F|nr:50S ribosomal protein L29 [Legionella fairfieldensis]